MTLYFFWPHVQLLMGYVWVYVARGTWILIIIVLTGSILLLKINGTEKYSASTNMFGVSFTSE